MNEYLFYRIIVFLATAGIIVWCIVTNQWALMWNATFIGALIFMFLER